MFLCHHTNLTIRPRVVSNAGEAPAAVATTLGEQTLPLLDAEGNVGGDLGDAGGVGSLQRPTERRRRTRRHAAQVIWWCYHITSCPGVCVVVMSCETVCQSAIRMCNQCHMPAPVMADIYLVEYHFWFARTRRII